MRRSLLAFLAASALFADGSGGIPPRPRGADYPVQRTSDNLTLAAALLTPAEAKKVFTADLDRSGFLVFEVAAYPAEGARIELAPDQFTLSLGAGDGTLLATSSPEAIVEAMYQGQRPTPQAHGKVQVYNSATIGYETGSGGRRGGVYAGGGTAVGIGDPGAAPPPSPPARSAIDRDSLQVALAAREFPNTTAARPVAGYLYFEKPRFKPKNGVYELKFIMTGMGGRQIVLPVPVKTGK
jgi:hypothetical protein